MPALRICTTITMSPDAEKRAAGLYRLLAWSSPAFPTGGFSYSHGLEAAVADGVVHDRDTLQRWVGAIVLRGSGRIDADILCQAYAAALAGDGSALADANRRGLAYRATAELALESEQQGAAFAAAWRAAWRREPGARPTAGEEMVPTDRLSQPAAFAVAAAADRIPFQDALLAYFHAFTSNLVSAGIRLGVIGQTDGQGIIASLEPEIIEAAHTAPGRPVEAFGAATFAADLASMAHETQYTRLFRS